MSSAADLIERTERRRRQASSALDDSRRSELGQFFTPAPAAALIASFPDLPESGELKVLDPGAGVGSLTAAIVARVAVERPNLKLDLTVFEVDGFLQDVLDETLTDCADVHPVIVDRQVRDFIQWAADAVSLFDELPVYDLIVMNPPYRKIGAKGVENAALANMGIHTTNLYTAFVAIALRLLSPNGQLVAITPRSFANGTYFKSFRSDLLNHTALRRIHIFEKRNQVFREADVLQENIIFHCAAGSPEREVIVSSNQGYADVPVVQRVPLTSIINPSDKQRFIHIATDPADLELAARVAALPATLSQLDLQVSTGRVVDFRTKVNLRSNLVDNAAPLIYPSHLSGSRVVWPESRRRKANALAINNETRKLLLPTGSYVLVKRFTSKEEPRRVSAALLKADDLPGSVVAIENHINVFHNNHQGLEADIAAGLTAYLNSRIVDRYVRIFSGHTQINAGDLRSLRYPDVAQLREIGVQVGDRICPGEVDEVVEKFVPFKSEVV